MKRLFIMLILGVFCRANAQIWLLDQSGCRFYDIYESEMSDISIEWDGACKDGYLSGKGTLKKYKGGELTVTFTGELEFGRYKNYVKWTWPNGTSYEGELKNGNMSGKGKFTWANGNKYIGDFVEGERTGKGKFIWANGDVYEGDFLNSVKTGRGKFYMKNGDIYDGDFLNNKFNGWGKIFYAQGDMFEGEFKNGKRNGTGRYDFANSNTYIYFKGSYINDKKNGPGKLFYPDGTFIEAVWTDDQMSVVKSNSSDMAKQSAPTNKSETLNTGSGYKMFRTTTTHNNSKGYRSNSDPNNRPKMTGTETGMRMKSINGSYKEEDDVITASEDAIVVPVYKWEFKGSWIAKENGIFKRTISILRNGQPYKVASVNYSFNVDENVYNIDVLDFDQTFTFLYKPQLDHSLVEMSSNQSIFGVKDLEMAFFHSVQYSFENTYK